jgi:hypothetical protein
MKPEGHLTSIEAGEYLGYAPITMKMSRASGKLAGRAAPPHHKRNYRGVYYLRHELDAWKGQQEDIPDIPATSKPVSLSDVSDDELGAEIDRRLNTCISGFKEQLERIKAGGEHSYEKLTKKQVGLIQRFNRDYMEFWNGVHLAFSIAASAYVDGEMKEERARLSKWQKEHREQVEALEGRKYYELVRGIDKTAIRKIKSFIHSDKHVGCPSQSRADSVSVILDPLLFEIECSIAARESLAKQKADRKRAAEKAAATRARKKAEKA